MNYKEDSNWSPLFFVFFLLNNIKILHICIFFTTFAAE